MRILIADADLITRTLLERSLGQAGYDVVVATSAAETESSLRSQENITALVMDGRPSAGFGPPLCSQLRQRLGDRPLFVMMMLKREEGVDLRAALESGANEIISKPVNIEELINRLSLGVRLTEAESSLWSARAYLGAIMDHLDVAVVITAPDGRVVQANEALARVGGVTPEDIIGRDRDRVQTHWEKHLPATEGAREGRHHVELPGRHRRVLRVTERRLALPWGQVRLELCQDATKEVLYDELTEKAANLDPTTGVLGREGAELVLKKALDRCQRNGDGLSVATIKIAGLPLPNGGSSQATTDTLVRALAQRFVKLTRTTDEVARWAQDMFVLVLHNASETQAEVVTRRLEKAVATWQPPEAPELRIEWAITPCTAEDESPVSVVERARLKR